MMNLVKRILYPAALVGLLIILYFNYAGLNVSGNRIVKYFNTPITTESVLGVEKDIENLEENIALGAWTLFNDQKIDTGSQQKTLDSVTHYYGQGRMSGDYNLVSGRIPLAGEEEVVLLSSFVRDLLFSYDTENPNFVEIEKKKYEIVGVYESEKYSAVLSSEMKKDDSFHVMELEFDEDKSNQQTKELIGKLSLPPDDFSISHREIKELITVMITFLGLILGIFLIIAAYNKLLSNSASSLRSVVFFVILFVSALFLPKLLSNLPPDWIPNKWSDFSFWSGRITVLKNSLNNIFSAPGYGRILMLKNNLLKFFGFYIASLLVLIVNIVEYVKSFSSNYR